MPKASEASTSSNHKPYKRPHKGNNDGGRRTDKGQVRSAGGGQHRRLPKAPSGDSGPAEQGISKIKASLRQTKRLLAKENLAPDVRQEAERRLISLEQDLETRQSSEHDRKNAERYHKVRFFERQKLVRLIKKIKKTADGESKAVKADLREKRVLLNYVLHYPSKYKYVALFPSNGESPLTKPEKVAVETEASRRAAKTYEQAQEVRTKVIQAMEKGELSSEPEVDLEKRGEAGGKRSKLDFDEEENDEDDAKKSKSSSSKIKKAKKSAKKSQDSPATGIEGDDFFAQSDEE